MKTENKGNDEFKKQWDVFNQQGGRFVGSLKILEDPDLSCHARVLFYIISSIGLQTGVCYAVNDTLAVKLGRGSTMVKKYLDELEKKNLVISQYSYGSRGTERNIFINFQGMAERYFEPTLKPKGIRKWVNKTEFNKNRRKTTLAEVREKMAANKKARG